MVVPPDKLGFVESAGLAAVAYGPDTREQMNTAMDFIGHVKNPMSALPQLLEHVTQLWTQKSTSLVSLADGADMLVAGMNEQRLAANVAEYHRIPLAAVHFFPAQVLELGRLQSHITQLAEDAQRGALGLPEATGPSTRQMVEIQGYDELCLPGPAAEWVESGRQQHFVGALTLGMPTDADEEVLSWIADGTPPIYFGFGSTPVASAAETVAMISGACTQLGERALICSGANDFTHIPHPNHVKIVGALNHATIFPACRAVVHHGGAGTTAAGMRAGVPTLILWIWLDQPIWAAAVSQLEVGVGRPFSATTQESLVADLRLILSPQCVTRAREVATQMSKPGESIASAADLLEDAARLGRLG